MPEKIYIDGFAGLNNFEMELNRINVLIDPQASGKSVVAKLVYFFNDVVLSFTQLSMRGLDQELQSFIEQEFKNTFNLNLIKNNFTIKYERHNFKATILQKEKLFIKAEGDALFDMLANIKNLIKPLQALNPNININEFIENNLFKMGEAIGADIHNANFFIPASRSFTSLIKNIKLLVENTDVPAAIDRFLLKFSAVYQQHRQHFKKEGKTLLSKETNSFDTFTKALINANVEFINDEDYLVYEDERRVALSNASSGEQALIPLLVYLKKLHQKGKSHLKTYLFFEEPELHIFPKFQFTLIQLLMFIYNECNVRLFITTHSPYVLSTFNDLMQAAELETAFQNDQGKLEQLHKIVPSNEIVKPEDLNAYEIENGKATLLAREYGLISENIIDKVSDEGSLKFGELLDMLPADA